MIKLDCGDNSCLFKENGDIGMRTNGGCACFGSEAPGVASALKFKYTKLLYDNKLLNVENAKLREALKPFANWFFSGNKSLVPSYDDYRRAADLVQIIANKSEGK